MQAFEEVAAFIEAHPELLVAVGPLPASEGAHVSDFLARSRLPFVAEASSNLRGVDPLRCADKIFRHKKPTGILRLGGVPSFRFWRNLETNSIEVLSLSLTPFSGLARASRCQTVESYKDLSGVRCERSAASFLDIDRSLQRRLDELLRKYPQSELALLRQLDAHMPATAALYLGNSMPIREWPLAAQTSRHTFANRGANGIDGQVATFLGVAEASAETWAVIGDQTALYDLNALALSRSLSQRKRRLVIVNNGGGKIFSHLSYSASLKNEERKVIENLHRWNFDHWAEMFAWDYIDWRGGELQFNKQVDDIIIEMLPDLAQTQHFWREWHEV